MTEAPLPEKMVVAIVSGTDGERLIQALVRAGLPATKIGSAGGFLRRGSATVLSGVPAAEVERVLALIRATCLHRTEMTPVAALPLPGTAAGAESTEVRIGGAVTFVLDIERFERI